jgi:hypothetical protein
VTLRHRAMQPGDIRECVDCLAQHPLIGPRYGPAIELLPEAWLRMLKCEPHFAAVFFADEGPRAPICFFGINAVVHDDFLARNQGTGAILVWAGTRKENSEGRDSSSHRQTTARGKFGARL